MHSYCVNTVKEIFCNMAKFKCIELGCDNYNKEIMHSTVKWVYCKERKELVTSPPIVCDSCGSGMVYIEEKKDYSSIAIGKFASMDDSGKKQMLLDRAKNHAKGRQREEKETRKKEAIKNYFKNE